MSTLPESAGRRSVSPSLRTDLGFGLLPPLGEGKAGPVFPADACQACLLPWPSNPFNEFATGYSGNGAYLSE